MTNPSDQIVNEVRELIGADPPAMLEEGSPILAESALEKQADEPYLIGLIGGKEVGKSALVNALAGREITASSSHGAGTDQVIAYCHQSRADRLRELLEREVNDKYRIIAHSIDRLSRQVLLDLPDIDSHYAEHMEITRRMLRHILFPIWMQSVEKYADQRPRELLAKVAAGNDPGNFIFCLNKADQVEGIGSRGLEVGNAGIDKTLLSDPRPPIPDPQHPIPPAATELRDDYAARIARTLGLESPPRVYLISAIHPERYDLPELQTVLSRQRTTQNVTDSKGLAERRRTRSLLAWLEDQKLADRARRLARLEEEAGELAAARIGTPLLDKTVPRILEDPGYRLAMVDEVMSRRVARWPIVNLVHVLMSPVMSLWRANIGAGAQSALRGTDGLVDAYFQPDARPIASIIQSTFAQLQQSQPAISGLYQNRKLWEAMPADLAAAELRTILTGTIERQRAMVDERLAGKGGLIPPLFRWLLTLGAVLWFPFIQPVLEQVLQANLLNAPLRLGLLIVQLFGVTYLLKNVTFMGIYFLVLWLWLRWNTQRRVARLLAQWKSADHPDPSLNLTRQTLQWLEDLLEPICQKRRRLDALVQRTGELRDSLKDRHGIAA